MFTRLLKSLRFFFLTFSFYLLHFFCIWLFYFFSLRIILSFLAWIGHFIFIPNRLFFFTLVDLIFNFFISGFRHFNNICILLLIQCLILLNSFFKRYEFCSIHWQTYCFSYFLFFYIISRVYIIILIDFIIYFLIFSLEFLIKSFLYFIMIFLLVITIIFELSNQFIFILFFV